MRTERVEQACQTSSASRSLGSEEDEIGVRGPAVDGQVGQRGGHPAALLGDAGDPALHLGHVAQREHAGQLRLGREVVGQHDRLAGAHDLGVGHRYPRRAPARAHVLENVRVTTRPGSLATGPGRRQRSRADHVENCPYASSTMTRPGRALEHGGDGLGGLGATGRVVGRAQERDVGPFGGDEAARVVAVDEEVVVADALHHFGPRDARDVRVERVRGLEQCRPAARSAEGEQEGLEHLVGAVGAEDLVGPTPCSPATAWRSSVAGRSG